MDGCLQSLKSCLPLKDRRRGDSSNNEGEQYEMSRPSQQRNKPKRSQRGATSSNIPESSQAQTQASLENAPREVNKADFNRYMTVERIKGQVREDKSGSHLVGYV